MRTSKELKELESSGVKVKYVNKYGVKATIIGEPNVDEVAEWITEYAAKKQEKARAYEVA